MYSFYEYLQSSGAIYLIVLVLLSLMLTAGYYTWAMQRTIFGRETTKVDLSEVHDVNRAETVVLAALCALIVLFGVCPWLVTGVLESASVLGAIL